MMSLTEEVLILILSLIGFIISFYIWHKKNKNQELVCFIKEHCNEVVRSKYSRTFGIKNELAGIFYYIFIFITSALLIFTNINFNLFNILRIFISGISALLSIYLIFVQHLILKKWCEYCLATSLINIVIFLLILF